MKWEHEVNILIAVFACVIYGVDTSHSRSGNALENFAMLFIRLGLHREHWEIGSQGRGVVNAKSLSAAELALALSFRLVR
jgi:hypothetical protein